MRQVALGPNKGGYEHGYSMRGRQDLLPKIQRGKKSTLINTTKGNQRQSTLPHQPLALSHALSNISGSASSFQKIADFKCSDCWPDDSIYPTTYPHGGDVGSLVSTRTGQGVVVPRSGFSRNDSAVFCDIDFSGSLCCVDSVTKRKAGFAPHEDFMPDDPLDEALQLLEADINVQMPEEKHKEQEIDAVSTQSTVWHELTEEEMNFPYKLHLMLKNATRDGHTDVVSWVKDGTPFKVHDTAAFVKDVFPNYFDQ